MGLKCPKCETVVGMMVGGDGTCPNCKTPMVLDSPGPGFKQNVQCGKCGSAFGMINAANCPKCGAPL